MTKIIQVSGVGCPHPGTQKGFTLMGRDVSEISEGEMDLLIARDNMVKKRNILAAKRGIGALKTQKFQNSIDVLTDALHGINSADPEAYMAKIEEYILGGSYQLEHAVEGIGSTEEIGRFRAAQAQRRQASIQRDIQAESVSGIGAKKKAAPAKTKTGGFLKKAATKKGPALKNVAKKAGAKIKTVAKKAGQGIKKGLVKTAKVATAPARIAVKLVLEVLLPKAAPFFLYLFINDANIIAKLPAPVKRKRDKAVKIKNFIVNVIGMKDAHFMGIVRNGIMKAMAASPETILSGILKQSGITGIGVVAMATLAVAAKAAPFVMQIIKKIVDAFKKKKEAGLDASESDAPGASDWEGLSEKEKTELSTDIKKQNDLPEPNEDRSEKSNAPTKTGDNSQSDSGSNESSSDDSGSGSNSGSGKRSGKKSGGGGSSSESTSDSGSDNSGSDSGSDNSGGEKTPNVPATIPVDSDENGEIKKEPFASGGRKEWNSLGK